MQRVDASRWSLNNQIRLLRSRKALKKGWATCSNLNWYFNLRFRGHSHDFNGASPLLLQLSTKMWKANSDDEEKNRLVWSTTSGMLRHLKSQFRFANKREFKRTVVSEGLTFLFSRWRRDNRKFVIDPAKERFWLQTNANERKMQTKGFEATRDNWLSTLWS